MALLDFSDDDLRELRQLVRERRTLRNHAQDLPPDDQQSPEVYLALVPSEGIPAARVINGVVRPGRKTCQIYRLRPIYDGSTIMRIAEVSGLTKPIYNYSFRRLCYGYISTARDAYGHWLAGCSCTCDGSSSSSSSSSPSQSSSASSSSSSLSSSSSSSSSSQSQSCSAGDFAFPCNCWNAFCGYTWQGEPNNLWLRDWGTNCFVLSPGGGDPRSCGCCTPDRDGAFHGEKVAIPCSVQPGSPWFFYANCP